MEDVVIDERFVAEVFNQQRPGKSVAVSGGEALEVSGDTQVVQVVQVDDPFCRYIVGTYAAVVVVGEYLSQRAAVGIDGKAHFPDGFGGEVVGPHVFVVACARSGCLCAARQVVVTAVYDFGGILDGLLPPLHIEKYAGAEGMHRIFVEVDAVVQRSLRIGIEVFLKFQQLCRTVEIVEDKLVGVFQRSAPHGFIAQIVLAQDNSQLAGGVLVAFVCLAEEFHQFRVGKCAGKVSLSATLVQLVEVFVVGGLFPYGVRAVEHEVAAVYHFVQRTVHGFDVGIGGFDFFPAPDVAVDVGVAVHTRSVCMSGSSVRLPE